MEVTDPVFQLLPVADDCGDFVISDLLRQFDARHDDVAIRAVDTCFLTVVHDWLKAVNMRFIGFERNGDIRHKTSFLSWAIDRATGRAAE
jgi:hypothetical protein